MLHSIFAFEVCARLEPQSELHRALVEALRNHPPNPTFQQKWFYYKTCTEALMRSFDSIERGCWDYFDDDKRALTDFDMWVKGMTTLEGARKEPSGNDAYRGEMHYLTFTMAFLIKRATACDTKISQLCKIPEDRLWRRESFWRILNGMKDMNFAAVKSDVSYLIPRDLGWGLTAADLSQPKFHYLRPLAP